MHENTVMIFLLTRLPSRVLMQYLYGSRARRKQKGMVQMELILLHVQFAQSKDI